MSKMGQTDTEWTVYEYLDILKSPATKRNYKISLNQFIAFLYPETEIPKDSEEASKIIDKLSLEYLTQDRDYSKDAAAYYGSLAKYAPKTQILKFGTIKSWLEINSITINPGVLRSLKGKGNQDAISEEHIPTNEEVERILKHLPLHGRALSLVILSSGMRPGEAHHLTFSDIDMEQNPWRIFLKAKATKTGKKRWTYLSHQAKAELEAWMGYREQFIQDKLNYSKDKEAYLEKTKSLIFPFGYGKFMQLWKAALEKSSLLKIDESTGRLTIRPHNLRKYFRTRGKWLDKDIPAFFQGHIRGVKNIYVRYDEVEEVVREAYIAAIPSLTIGEGFGDTEAVQKLEKKIDDIREEKQEVSDDVHYVLKMNKALSKEVDELRTQVNNLQGEIQHIVKWMDQEINSRAVLLSGGGVETIHATEEDALADLQEKKSAKNR
jgi:integrase/FtsZ-binding cell division protein ZapB